ncbi:hypothetical protein GCM10010387_16230 [Streptomyces inusitatus]|uniref:Uncharacterized protein n=1 Tax=Streptomyces inusitatus TaxID=68221 RepID=A0A918PVQ4_9ACTN|nr:hypothetical protein [Streptomyces inusitatus]GGZ23755.1 hypothetical protein GCM10010387_16230 [Streptomyces inusitatus]
MTWNSRLDVAEALEAAGWTGDSDRPLEILRHPSGAVWAVFNDVGDCGVTTPNGANTGFPGDTPDAVVIAACLAASLQLDPARVAELEERSAWLDCLEAAGLDSWPGVDTAREIRNEKTVGR